MAYLAFNPNSYLMVLAMTEILVRVVIRPSDLGALGRNINYSVIGSLLGD